MTAAIKDRSGSSAASEVLLFRGQGSHDANGQRLIVYPDAGPGGPQQSLELLGAHAAAAATAIRLSAQPRTPNELVTALVGSTELDEELALELVRQLDQAGILARMVPARERIQVLGEGAVADALRNLLAHQLFPSELDEVVVAVLGPLGTASWQEQLRIARGRGEATLSVSLEAAGAWIGPVIGSPQGPCPACLAARRAAADKDGVAGDVFLGMPRGVDTIAALALVWAERWRRGELSPADVLHIEPDSVRRRTVVPQPGCAHCSADGSTADLSTKAGTTQRFLAEWGTSKEHEEPSTTTRAAFLDEKLGPLTIQEFHAPGLLHNLPLVLGSIRLMRPAEHGLERMELSSVTFGSGMTPARRHLVAYAEGVERYAGLSEQADVRNKTFAELGHEAFSPEATIRFQSDQYTGEPSAPRRYEGQPLDWSWVYDLTAGDARLLAHDAIAFRRPLAPSAFRLLDDPFSSGTAAHRSLALAVERALLELIERDAFVLAWYLRLPLQELIPRADSSDEVHEMIDYLSKHGIALRFFDLRADFDLPCVLTLARSSRDHGPWHAGGHILSACAARTWTDAVRHGIGEVLGHFSVFGVLAPEGDKSVDPGTGEKRPWWEMFARYLDRRNDDPFSFLGSTARPIPLYEDGVTLATPERLDLLRSQFQARALPVFIRRLGGPDVRASGLEAVRACVPGMLRLAPSRALVNFGEARVEIVRSRWQVPEGLNPLPHPEA